MNEYGTVSRVSLPSRLSASRLKRNWFRRGSLNNSATENLDAAATVSTGDAAFKQSLDTQLLAQVKDTKEEVERQIDDARTAYMSWLEGRQTGSRRYGTAFQVFITRFSNFLTAYSGIVEVVKNASAPYGNLAYGTLSLLLIVVVNKTGNDEKIAKALAELEYSFPRLNLLSDIYPEPQIERLVAEAYRDMVDFARKAVLYYMSTSMRLLAAGDPQQELEFNMSIEGLRRKLVEVNLESTVLLHRRAKHIEEQNEKLLRGNKELKHQMKVIEDLNIDLRSQLDRLRRTLHDEHVQRDRKELAKFRALVNVPEASDHTNIQSCKRTLGGAFPVLVGAKPGKIARWYSQLTPDILNNEESYRVWLDSDHSCLLVLGGTSLMEGRSNISTCSWLSPAAIYVAEHQLSEDRHVAFYCCHPQVLSERCGVQEAILSLVCQVIGWQPDILRQNPSFLSLARTISWKDASDDVVNAIFKLLSDLLTELHLQEPVYIILDRADQCEYQSFQLIRKLMEVIQKARSMVKIMVVIDSALWGIDSWLCDGLKEDSGGFLVGRWDWNQQQVGFLDLMSLPN
ncbi:uncharacterized protein Z520_00805 [Fonsecaea multimorphosa CBS 102226]|uniref:Fungal STAND N-terminal Goodbye domain-containing protein n=1 Tax=Fonsecaea multimorphosa CBS 102226 TaxID=1442371 RepID=A0A0D2KDA7_9EURO|nr:uncharacterized protein Z520_00805 [Fonsecaea multimorphosa CBS 102226]KIY04113.1 hypothetical protein Z520_00805 [Fonsecaea multimorphosa CBS 102226]OAL31944.1 hypothetical protein AYO22_00814 [Fonsecaea multimorphosa]